MQTSLDKVIGKLLEQPILNFENYHLSFAELIYIAVIVAVAYAIFFSAKIFLNVQIRRGKIRSAQGLSLLQLFGYIVTIVALFFIMHALWQSFAYLFLGSTALLVGLGFGLQQLFLDLVSGVILLIDKNVNLGDVVYVDIPSGKENIHGKIYHIGLRATLLQTIDNQFMVVPNSKMLSSGVRSLMRDKGSVRFRINIQVRFGENMDLAKKILTDCVLADSRADKSPTPTIIIREFKDSGVLLEVRFWMKEIFNSENILSDIRFAILQEFNKQGLVIPYPHQVFIDFPEA
jgi:small-conductance mechanosensitive channel